MPEPVVQQAGEMPTGANTPLSTAAVETTTLPAQQESPETLKAELEKVRAMLKEANGEAAKRRKQLEAIEAEKTKTNQSEVSELQKLQQQLQEMQTRLDGKEKAELRQKIAEQTGLPAALAARLQGETPEELEADAKAMLAALPQTQTTNSLPANLRISATNPANAQVGETREQKKARLLGGNADVFSGGGVVWPGGKPE
jgi:superfamily I DNA/RNA helicase